MFSATLFMILLNGFGAYVMHRAELLFQVNLRFMIVLHIITIYILLKGVFEI